VSWLLRREDFVPAMVGFVFAVFAVASAMGLSCNKPKSPDWAQETSSVRAAEAPR